MIKVLIGLYFLVFALLILKRPGYSFPALLVCYLGMEQWAQSQDAFFGQNPMVLNVASGLLAGFGCVVAIVKGHRPLTQLPVWSLMAFYLLACTTYLWSVNRSQSMAIMTHAFPYVVTFMFVLPLTLNSMDDIKHALYGLLFAGVITLVLVFFTTNLIGNRSVELAEGAVNRYGQEEAGGSSLALAQLSGIVLLCASTLRSSMLFRIVRWGAIVIAMVMLFRAGSRGQMLGAIALVPIAVLLGSPKLLSRHLVIALVAIIAIVGIGYWAISFIPEGALGRWTVSNSVESVGHRFVYWQTLLQEWGEGGPMIWLFGLGLGASWTLYDTYPHNIPIQILGETGIVGLSLYLHFLFAACFAWFRLYRATAHIPHLKGVVTTFGAVMGYTFLLTLKQGGLSGVHVAWLFPIIMIRVENIASKNYAVRRPAAGTARGLQLSTT